MASASALPSQKTAFVPASATVHPENTLAKSTIVDDRRTVKIANADRLMWYMTDDEHPMVVNATVFLEQPISLQSLKDRAEEMVKEYPILSCKISSDFHWTPCRYDPVEHSKTVILSPEQNLQEYIASKLTQGIDFDRPMWEWEVVSKPDEGKHLLLVRVHHVVGDGVALMTLMDHLLGKEPAVWTYKKYHVVPVCATLTCGNPCYLDMVNGKWKTICGLLKLFLMIVFGFIIPIIPLSIMFMWKDPKNPLQMKGAHKKRVCAWSKDMSYEDIANIGHSIRGTVNDTCCAIISGALHRYLEQTTGKRPRRALKCIIPVSVRGKKERYHLNNRVGALFVSLPIGTKSRQRRLSLCKYRMDIMKLSPAVPVAMLFIRMTTKLLGNQLCKRLQFMYSAKASLIFSNVMGSPTEASFLGSKVLGIMGFVPLPGKLGLGVTVTSYNGFIKMGFSADPVALVDPGLFLRLLEEEFDLMRKEVLDKDVETA
mmetsp:Transcript_76235/g.217821  ORF Transcript_76235/g.217821 Transcript_76235/m.217821 type:complete len:484 (+) Transcript_76235:200-1651(+)